MNNKIYVNKIEKESNNKKDDLIELLLKLLVSAITLILASKIFKGFYVENIFYALITAALISVLNLTLKPFLIYITLPLTIMSYGILYPIVNLIILKLVSLLMGSSFVVSGWILPFFITIFISLMTKLLEYIFVKPFIEGR